MIKIRYFVHSTTIDNEKNLATGWHPGELSDLGKKQATALREIITDIHFDAVFSSDLKRAIKTTKLVFGKQNSIITDKRLRECDYGDFTGLRSDSFKLNLEEYIEKPFPNGESYKDVERRIHEFIQYLLKDFDGTYIAIVSHQAPQLAFEVLSNDKTWTEALQEDWRRKGSWKPGWDYQINS